MGRPFHSFHPDAERMMQQGDWPGNVRELQNAVERALIVARSKVIAAADLAFSPAVAPGSETRGGTLADVEQEFILEVLNRNRGERRAKADELGISLRTLQYRLKEYGLAGKE
jgi:DNA-binding NtrC family response regulator